MRRILAVLWAMGCLTSGNLRAQYWQPLGDGVGRWPWSLYGDSISDALYVGGRMENLPALTSEHVAKWDGADWTILSENRLDPGVVRDIVRFNGQIYAGGSFSDLTGPQYVGYWDGNSWNALPQVPNESIFSLLSHDRCLYVGGIFHEVDMLQSPGVAAWNGSQWTALPGLASNPRVYALAWFNGYLIAGGNSMPDANGQESDLHYYKDSTWQTLPGWQMGGWGDVLSLAVYQDELYVGGNFSKARGALANYIARWDGNQWRELGTGADFMVETLTVHRGELYAGGRFSYVDGIPAQYIAKWDGRQWCSLSPSNISGWITALTVWRDTLYASGGFRTIDGDTVNHVAKWMEDWSSSVCGPLHAPTALEPALDIPDQIRLYPNPAQGTVLLEHGFPGNPLIAVEVFNSLGQVVHQTQMKSPQVSIDLAEFASGIYYVRLLHQGEAYTIKMVRE